MDVPEWVEEGVELAVRERSEGVGVTDAVVVSEMVLEGDGVMVIVKQAPAINPKFMQGPRQHTADTVTIPV